MHNITWKKPHMSLLALKVIKKFSPSLLYMCTHKTTTTISHIYQLQLSPAYQHKLNAKFLHRMSHSIIFVRQFLNQSPTQTSIKIVIFSVFKILYSATVNF